MHAQYSRIFSLMGGAATDISADDYDHPMNKICPSLHPFTLSSVSDLVGHKNIKKGGGSCSTKKVAFIVINIKISIRNTQV